jgi:hypothetical protein
MKAQLTRILLALAIASSSIFGLTACGEDDDFRGGEVEREIEDKGEGEDDD